MRRPRRRGDHVGHGLGLREVEFPGQVGADGEFARLGHASARGGQQPEDFRDDVGGAVARDFDRVFARVGVRGAENGRQHVVDHAVAVGYRAVMHRVAVCLGERPPAPEYPVADGEGFSAADADDGDGPSGGGCRGDDGIVIGVHYLPSMRSRCPMRSLWALLRRFQRMICAVVTR